MICKGLLITSVLCSIAGEMTAAENTTALDLVHRWARRVSQSSPVLIKFRWRQRNLVFEKESVAHGEFYHDGQNAWAIRLNSAIGNEDRPSLPGTDLWGKPPEPFSRYAVICDAKSGLISYGEPDQCEHIPWYPVSATEPENVALSSFQEFSRNWSRVISTQLEFQLQMPLLLPKSAEFANHHVTLKTHANGDRWLTLTPDRYTFSAAVYQQIDGVFRPQADLPYAIRVIDRDAQSERHLLLDEIQLGSQVKIPHEAFLPPQTTGQGRIP